MNRSYKTQVKVNIQEMVVTVLMKNLSENESFSILNLNTVFKTRNQSLILRVKINEAHTKKLKIII